MNWKVIKILVSFSVLSSLFILNQNAQAVVKNFVSERVIKFINRAQNVC